MSDKVRYETRGRVGLFTLDRPAQRNAIDPDVTAAMNRLMAAFEADDEVWVGVVTGAGAHAFSAGADLKAIADGRLAQIVDVEPYGFAGIVRGTRHKPIIAAVNGAALAGGFEIVLACDLVVAAEHARFGLPEVRRGIIAGAGGLQRLPRRIAPAHALEMILTGEPIDAYRAEQLGLVNEVTPADRVLPRALELAETIAANAPIAVRESRAVAVAAIASDEQAAWDRAAKAWDAVLATDDAAEGPRAFAEGRPAVWRAR